LALTFHLYRSYRRHAPPSLVFLITIPPASLFFKANQMTIFWFLQMTGFAIWLAFGRRRDALKGAAGAAGVWILAILMSLTMGPWPATATCNQDSSISITTPTRRSRTSPRRGTC